MIHKQSQVQKEYKRWIRRATWLPETLRVKYGGAKPYASTTPNQSTSSGNVCITFYQRLFSSEFIAIKEFFCTSKNWWHVFQMMPKYMFTAMLVRSVICWRLWFMVTVLINAFIFICFTKLIGYRELRPRPEVGSPGVQKKPLHFHYIQL